VTGQVLEMPAAFDFLSYKIEQLDYKLDNQVVRSENGQNVEFEAKLDRNNQDPAIFRLNLKIAISGNPSVQLSILGFYKWLGEYVKNETEQCLHTSGASILYPYARAAISTISVLDGSDPIILQTVNFYELFADITVKNSQSTAGQDSASK
jgi:preprotein translocase subunit SecB